MKWNTYQDMENRAYSHILTTLFPEQTKTFPRIIVWSLIFLLDLTLGVAGAAHFGILQSGNPKVAALLLICAIVGIFWLQGVIWYTIVKLFRK